MQQALDAINAGKKVTETHSKSGGDTDFSVAEAFGIGADAGEYEKTCPGKMRQRKADLNIYWRRMLEVLQDVQRMANAVAMINKFVDNYRRRSNQ